MDKQLLEELKKDGFYKFFRRHIGNSDVLDIILNFVDLTTLRLSDEDYEELKNQVCDPEQYEEVK